MIKKLICGDESGIRPQAAYTIMGLVVLGVGYFVYSVWAGASGQLAANLACADPGCGYTESRPLQVGQSFPETCPRCGKPRVYPALRCPDCGKPHVHHQMLGLAGPTLCTQCGTEIRYGG